jgi:hypothetical protein
LKTISSTLFQYKPLPDEPEGSPNQLRDVLFQFAKQEFKKEFRFDWKVNMLPGDIPGNSSPMVPVTYGVLLDFARGDPTLEDIEDRVSFTVLSCVHFFFQSFTRLQLLSRKDLVNAQFPWGKPPIQGAYFVRFRIMNQKVD